MTSWLLTRLNQRAPQNLTEEEIRGAQITFSQFGEDMAVLRWVEELKMIPQIYVDVGCYHPIHCSNTLLLHKPGWKGVNVDLDEQEELPSLSGVLPRGLQRAGDGQVRHQDQSAARIMI